ncbi:MULTISPECIES: FecR family protein [Butyricimonas]|uniref:FecR family protein n=1 Tax=Butyricimonas TaxID=574697 RepID=UPI0007FB4187|nr:MULTISPECIES: FecR domain-containing protein [Butyricimonas]
MKKLKLDQEIEDWLVAFFNGELEEAEEENVSEWLKKCPENREAYDVLLEDYLRVRWSQENVRIREDRAKKVIFSSLKKKRHPWLYYSAVASVVLLLVFAGILFTREKTNVLPQGAVAAEIKPVRSQAVLVLSSGERVELASSHLEIRERDGLIVKVDSNSGIRYDSLATEVTEKVELIYNKIIVPRGGEYFVTLSDGTKVWLDAESELEYPVNFSVDCREVKLKGEAYFSVTKDKGKPFLVQSGEYGVRVYGTEFNVNAYNPRQIETVLVEGTIGFKANVSSEERMLQPNHLAVVNMETGVSEIRKVDIYPYIAWKNQDIVFANERLESIMEKVARWYDVVVFFQNEGLKDLRFDCNMQRYADIKDLFFFMEKTSNACFSINGRTVTVSKK